MLEGVFGERLFSYAIKCDLVLAADYNGNTRNAHKEN